MVLYTLPPISIIAVTIEKFWFRPLKLCFSIKTIGIGYYSRVAFDGVGRVCFYGFCRHSISSLHNPFIVLIKLEFFHSMLVKHIIITNGMSICAYDQSNSNFETLNKVCSLLPN